MKYKLIKPINPSYSATQQILTNRGIDFNDINHYMLTTDNDINDPSLLGGDVLESAAIVLVDAMYHKQKTLVVVDSDCDGFTSSALLINYLYDLSPTWVLENLHWFMHSGKQHGLKDCLQYIQDNDFRLVICPDAATNDVEECEILTGQGIQVICLDHHEREVANPHLHCINNQTSSYPNKDFSGVGITWQFCRYIDSLLKEHYADDYLDLVALGNSGDMMSLRSMETKHLINKGFEENNIHNPFIYTMWQKNRFKLGDHITSWGAVFYIVPFVNAMVRSGTQEEKELLFNSMLNFKAFTEVSSTKRGCKGQMETIVEQAVRTCTNVKNRQTRAQDVGMELLESRIESENMLKNKVLLFLIEPGQIDRNIAGLCANKIMAKYQRPVCILTRVEDNEHNISYQGSARGCDKVGITEFKDICAATGYTQFVAG